MSILKWIVVSLLLVSVQAFAIDEPRFEPGMQRMGWSFQELAMVPILSGGRIKPFDTVGREVMLFETGSRYYEGWDPVDLMLSIMTAPDIWDGRAFLQIGREDVRRQIGLDDKRIRFSPHEIFQDSALLKYFEEIMSGHQHSVSVPMAGGKEKEDPREAELHSVVERLSSYRRLISGDVIPLVPEPAGKPWLMLNGTDQDGQAIRQAFAHMALAYRGGRQGDFEQHARELRLAVESRLLSVSQPNQSDVERGGLSPSWRTELKVEYLYNKIHPFLFAWIFYLTGAVFWVSAIVIGKLSKVSEHFSKVAMGSTILAYGLHLFGFALRCYVAGRPPVTNMYESIIWVMFGAVTFSLILYSLQRQAVLLAVSCIVATAGLVLADAAPAMMDPSIHPLVPVLRSNYWLTIHVLTITSGYAAFALSLGLGNVALFQYLKGEHKAGARERIAMINQLNYRAVQIGVVLLAAGTILGGVWADYSWGRFWGWDPKEVWALIALLNYLALLHARLVGWAGQFAYALWTVIAFSGVVMAWYGVNFVLGVGLHSYGFSTGGRGAVAALLGAQLVFCLIVVFFRSRHQALANAG